MTTNMNSIGREKRELEYSKDESNNANTKHPEVRRNDVRRFEVLLYIDT